MKMQVQVQLSQTTERNRQLDNNLIKSTKKYKWKDLGCCIAFGIVWLGVIIISGISFATGNPRNLLDPFDSTGYQCGISPGYENYLYIYYNSQNQSQFACINTCPTTKKAVSNATCYYNNSIMNCSNFGMYATETVVRICYPSNSAIAYEFFVGLQIEQEWISDLNQTYMVTFIVFVQSMILSVIIFLFMIRFPKQIIFISLALHLALFIIVGIILFLMSNSLDFASKITDYYQLLSPFIMKILAYVCWSTAIISLLLILCYCQKIKYAISIMQISAKFLIQKKLTLLMIPLFTTIIFVIILMYFILLGLYIFSSGGVIKACTSFPYGCVHWDIPLRKYFGLPIFGFVWSCLFVIAANKFLIASVVSQWYFQGNTSMTILISLKKMIYQLGSICLGSLILSILSIFQFLIQFLGCIDHKRKKNESNTPNWKRCYFETCNIFKNIVEKFLRLITRNAYIVMAITGESFFESSKIAYSSIRQYKKSYIITHNISRISILFIKLAISIISSMTGYGIITTNPYFRDNIYQSGFPSFIFFIIGFVVSSIFAESITNSADSILICSLLQTKLKLEKDVAQESKIAITDLHDFYEEVNNEHQQ